MMDIEHWTVESRRTKKYKVQVGFNLRPAGVLTLLCYMIDDPCYGFQHSTNVSPCVTNLCSSFLFRQIDTHVHSFAVAGIQLSCTLQM